MRENTGGGTRGKTRGTNPTQGSRWNYHTRNEFLEGHVRQAISEGENDEPSGSDFRITRCDTSLLWNSHVQPGRIRPSCSQFEQLRSARILATERSWTGQYTVPTHELTFVEHAGYNKCRINFDNSLV